MNPRNLFSELKRRNVYKVAVAYAVVGWLLVQVTTQVFPIFEIPNWALRLIVLAIIIGFPIALVIAWAFELTPEGIKRTEDVDPFDSRSHHGGQAGQVLPAGRATTRVAAQTGEPDRALAAIQKLLSIPYSGPMTRQLPLTPALLRLDPMFDPLRNDLRFQKLAAEPGAK